ncbi:archaeal proteasome endopeptidase complex subunit beta [Archaeoglobus profundus]|uniref:Proteasome subunit beta n=1 Tax=Archaeoglobus profundus (strain DSM 5631 / JCM 9629 / NBRC 100127 / Av18) TaxID=572546 RepID=PSB_ARCPA|nr:archaeal proteasome endopeptidase complex subunit beta [Archaeoglobus profundus]D2RGT4.1 RecName: Full=Proteasome subunit beta; AltName: Full=20S proteasome beta subunit; AltName: Full=Proteasome core protein PsmB; Flags: Precursor [Archaeoglobus profundus DSM 5631]ADB57509.1 Proteasome endopeptidase complex [Archaeoglobus profundus DSM 5631]
MLGEIQDKVYKGTTTVGLVCKDGVVLATEKRATMGNFIASRRAKKIYRIADRVAMTTAGAVGDAQFLARLISVEIKLYEIRKEEKPTVKAIATLLSNILNSVRWFPYFVQLLVGGVDKRGPSIYSIDLLGGAIEEIDIVATGSGSPTAYGVLEDRYTPEITVDDGVELAVRAIYSAMRRDSASGDGIDVVKITKDGYFELSKEEVDKILSSLRRA